MRKIFNQVGVYPKNLKNWLLGLSKANFSCSLGIVILLVVLMGGCTKPPVVPRTRNLQIAFNAFPCTADPRKSGDFTSATLVCFLYDGLMRIRPDGTVEPALADDVSLSSDQCTYTFHLRRSVWNDGTPVTARDFERSWKQILDPAFPSLCPYLFYAIKNAQEARNGLVPLDQIGIRAVDNETLEVVLEQPTPYFLSLTAFPSFFPTPLQDDHNLFECISSNSSLIGNGPFLIDHVQSNAEIVLKKNDKYWNASRIKLPGVQISIVSNEITAWQMFQRGDLDWIGGAICPILADSLQGASEHYRIEYCPIAATTFCTFHTQHPYLSNRHLRQALSLAINRHEIVEQITQMNELAATRFIPPSLMGFRNKTLYQPFDPERARLYLERALHELVIERKDLRGLELSFRGTQINRQIAQAIQRHWKQTLDIDIALNQCEANMLRDRLQRHDFQIALHFMIAQYNDPLNILERFQDSVNPKNLSRWMNAPFSQTVQEASRIIDPLDRFNLIEKAEEILAEEMPFAPIFHWTSPSVSQPWVHNLQMTPNGAVLFEYCWIAEEKQESS